jgi:hypothetical protein
MAIDAEPTLEQHTALLHDLREQIAEMPESGALTAARKPYRAGRTAAAVRSREDDPAALVEYVTKIALQETSETLSALVKVNRLDLSIEFLVADETKVYAPLFSDATRAAALEKLGSRAERVSELAAKRGAEADAADRRLIETIRRQRVDKGQVPYTEAQERSIVENRARKRVD